jgi:diguanylate cyclase (GGDEF)-like protein
MLDVFHNIPVRAKFFAASGVLLICLLGLGTYSYLMLDKSAAGLERIATAHLPTQRSVLDLTQSAMLAHMKVSRYVTLASNGATEAALKPLGDDILAELDSMTTRLRLLARHLDLPLAERATTTPLPVKWTKYARSVKDTLEVARVDPAMSTMMLGATDEDFEGFASILQHISFLVTQETQLASYDLSRVNAANRRWLALGGLLSVLVSIVATAFLGSSVVRPIRAVTKAMQDLSSGREDTDPGYRHRKDEIGRMVGSIALFRRHIDDQNELLRRREEELRKQNLRFDTAINNMSQGLCMFDAEQRLVVCNDRFATLYGLQREQLVPGITLRQIVERRIANGFYAGTSPDDYMRERVAPVTADSDTIQRLSDGRLIGISRRLMAEGGWVTTHEDVTERERLNARLEHNNRLLTERTALLQAIIDNFPGGIGFFDAELRVVVCNERAKTMLDIPERMFANGPPLLVDILRFNAERGEYGPGNVEEQVSAKLALAKDRQTYQFERERPNGTVLDVRGVPIDGGGFITTYMDVTERRRSEVKIAHMARHDALTGLPNRALFREHLDKAVAGVRKDDACFAVFMLDLNRFKEINDTLGHPVGDALLKVVAERLRCCVRDTDALARLGGDEFAIVQPLSGAQNESKLLAERIRDAIAMPFDLDGQRVTIGTSIGIAVAPRDGSTCDELLKNADLALYRAKSERSEACCFFAPEMNARREARRSLERDLRSALANGEFELHYQPLLNLERDEVCGFEALLRWTHPERGMVSPTEFIPVAEETGLIVPIGEWVLRQACSDAAAWPSHIKVAVNLSRAQFKCRTLMQTVINALARAGLAAHRLELEITESAMLQDAEGAFATLRHLRELGIRIGLDDFGIGYSSLSNVRKFRFDKIKIDRSFIRDVSGDDVEAIAVVRSVAQLGFTLGIATTAEGVESQEQLDRVRAEGCTESQGDYIGRPAPVEALAGYFAQAKAAASAA